MAGYKRKIIDVGGLSVKVCTGTKTQTINVFDQSQLEGNYSEVHRIDEPERFVETAELEKDIRNLDQLRERMAELGAANEGPRPRPRPHS